MELELTLHLGSDCAVEDFIICRFRNYYSVSSTTLRSRPVSFPRCYQDAVMSALKKHSFNLQVVGCSDGWGLERRRWASWRTGGLVVTRPPPGFPIWRRGLGAEILESGSPCNLLSWIGKAREGRWLGQTLCPSPAQPPAPSRPGTVPAESV